LLTIATRLALDARKKKKLDQTSLDDDSVQHHARTGSTPEIALERRQLGHAISVAAARLPDDQCAALVLSELHGLSIAEIAGALGIPENTAKTRLFRAREKMREALKSEWRTP
jgi:RNA polymerase sigma-70 factor (ECF subfamily)